MKKVILLTVAVAMFIAMPLSSVFAYEALIGHTGVLQYDESLALDGYVLFSPSGKLKSYLIDMEGYIINEWLTNSGPGLHDRLLPNGHLLRGYTPEGWGRSASEGVKARPVSIGGAAGGVQEYDWDGNLLWEYPAISDIPGEGFVQHHSFYRMNNGNTLILLWEEVTMEDSLALGRDPALVGEQYGLWPDAVIEVNPAKQIVWEWHAFNHLVQNRDPGLPNYGEPIDNPNKFDMNFYVPTRFGTHDWSHCNTIEYNEVTDQIIVNFRNWGEFYVFDHSTPDSAGSILYRWGNPGAYGAGELPEWPLDGDQKLWGPHCAVWLGTGDNVNFGTLGNILVLDNGWLRPSGTFTRSVEVSPNSDNWLDPDQFVWDWTGTDKTGFYSTFQCGTQRLSNGNTFVTSTDGGHFVEVTHEKKVVWEFVVPGFDADGTAQCYTNDRVLSSVHRAHKYGADYPGFVGKDMSRKGHIAPGCTQMWDLWGEDLSVTPVEAAVPITGWGIPPGTTSEAGAGAGEEGGGGGGY
jgi:hypothetical protein